MYKYKLNNAYTTYVYETYYSEAKRLCDKYRGNNSGGRVLAQRTRSAMVLTAAPLANGTKVYSKYFGNGIVQSTDDRGIMRVHFGERDACFLFPDVIKKGQLRLV